MVLIEMVLIENVNHCYLSFQCTGFRTEERMKKYCDGLQECIIEAGKNIDNLYCSIMGYLDMTYSCIKKGILLSPLEEQIFSFCRQFRPFDTISPS